MLRKMISKLSLFRKIFENYVRNIKSYLKAREKLRPEAPMVFFDLQSRRTEPYYFVLIFSFHEAGYTIFLKHDFMFIGNCFKAGRQIFKLSRLKISYSLPENLRQESILISDHPIKHSEKRWKKVVTIDFDVYSEKDTNSAHLTMPFHMSPEQYISGRFRQIDALRNSVRTIRIFFSGNQDREVYSHPIFDNFFHKLNRIQLLDTLTDGLEDDEIMLIEHKDQWALIKDSYCNKFVLNHWTWSPENSSNLESRVANEDWLAVLARSDFFLATPGIRMPLCFNVIEAMAVGTIPVIEYPEYFNPPLEHLKNCVVFNGETELISRVHDVFRIEKEKLNSIKRGVIKYYDEYLRPESWVNHFMANSTRRMNLYVNATEISYQEYLNNKAKRV